MSLYPSWVFEAHSCQCADTSTQGKEENERFRKATGKPQWEHIPGRADPVRDNEGWDKTVNYLKSAILPSDHEHRQQQKKGLYLVAQSLRWGDTCEVVTAEVCRWFISADLDRDEIDSPCQDIAAFFIFYVFHFFFITNLLSPERFQLLFILEQKASGRTFFPRNVVLSSSKQETMWALFGWNICNWAV